MGESAVLTEQDVEVVEEQVEFRVPEEAADRAPVTAPDGVAAENAAAAAVTDDVPVTGADTPADDAITVAPASILAQPDEDAAAEDTAAEETAAEETGVAAEAVEARKPALKPVQAGLRPGLRSGLSR